MNDRELLELAAKAAGMDPDEWVYHRGCFGMVLYAGGGSAWNPRTDDGDAFRLAVKLGLKVMPYPIYSDEKHSVEVSRLMFAPSEDDENTYIGPQVIERYGSDKSAATRLAIVRAAAEIGKDMK